MESVHVFERSVAGVAAVKFADWLGADRCVRLMHGRRFDGRVLACEYYDGTTDYTVRESEQELAAREESFGAWLEEGSDDEENGGGDDGGGGGGGGDAYDR